MATRAQSSGRRRLRARVEGTVQGVGFRPFVHRLASDLRLGGSVRNDAGGVDVEVEGDPEAVQRFLTRLRAEAPPLAAIDRLRSVEVSPAGESGFRIEASGPGGGRAAPVAADTATCRACLAELFDPADRRHRYPFVNCTDCGPRFTIVRAVPYDRSRTTMAGFEMCERCRAEYEDPADRRFHAEPNACPECGPRARLLGAGGHQLAAADPVAAAAQALREGAVVAVKGIGGYHLACRAADERAVAALRARKRREDKPFALMVGGVDGAREIARPSAGQERLLCSRERPIVLAARRDGAAVAEAVAPSCPELALMLPYTPLHHLLLADVGEALVMTSANLSEEPIAHRDRDALRRLAGIADLFLVHDRPIETPAEDSIAVSVTVPGSDGEQAMMLRRSRGHVPRGAGLPRAAARPLLACGAELKSTFCVAAGAEAWIGPHVGDLRSPDALGCFERGIAHLEALLGVAPQVCAHDLHPDYLSTRYALERDGVEQVAVQHHHAHFAACLAEHRLEGPAVGAIFDGSGYGIDGTVWGGEILSGGLDGFERAGHLRPVPMPGGEAAIREPWRMACSWLREAIGDSPPPPPLRGSVGGREWAAVQRIARSGIASPLTSSAGRLFDAVSALCGIRAAVTYEGQAAVELQAACDPAERGAYRLPVTDADCVIDPRPMLRELLADLDRDVPVAAVAARFHNGLAAAAAEALCSAAEAGGAEVAVLSGGAFQNRVLLERTAALAAATGLRVLVPLRVPPNDGGISYGQAAVAAARS